MTELHGFELLREGEIQEYRAWAQLYRHRKTGAELLSLQNDDENKSFGIAFRTPPQDSTGVAHILEHAVLCGSRKYPLKDPFVELAKGSLNTFLNAFTYSDKTCYPVASQNLQDFYNLVDVYLDTVFHPRLSVHTFEEQGWHYEVEDPEQPLIYKGVVFNEMKGAYASPESLLHRYAQQSIFPDTTYGVDSGGDPRHIPDLSHEQLKAFHQAHYHPSNARIFFSGDDDPARRLSLLDSYLDGFDRSDVSSLVALQSRFKEPRQVSRSYATGQETPGARKAMMCVNWMLAELTDPRTALGLQILGHILLGTPASPLRKALIDSGLGEDITGGLSTHLRQALFSSGLKGIASEDSSAVEDLIVQTLQRLAREGIDPETIKASLNTVEFSLRENNTGSFPRGLSLMLRSLTTWLYDGDPLTPLAFEAPLQAIKASARTDRYFEELIRQHIVENRHRTTVLLTPDPEMELRETREEQERLQAARARMSPADLQALVEKTRELKKIQETPDPPEVLATVPSLKLSDLERENKSVPLETVERSGTRILYHDLFTSGILYLDLGLDLHTLPQELLPYVPLFGRGLLQLGTETQDFVQLTQRIGSKTGGIRRQTFSSPVQDSRESASWLFLSGKAVAEQAGDLLSIIHDVLLMVRFDNQERFHQMALEERARYEASLVPSGSAYVDSRLRAHFHEAAWVSEATGGISYLFFLRRLVETIESDWPAVLATLEQIRQILLNRNAMLCNVTLDEVNWARFAPQLEEFLSTLPVAASSRARWSMEPGSPHEGLTIPAPVNYVGKAANLYDLGYKPHGSASVILKHLRTTWLWERVRKEGGAYGTSCHLDRLSGVFTCTSYRDPNLLATLDIYDRAGQFLRERPPGEMEITRSIIGAIGGLDQHQLPDAKGHSSLTRSLAGITEEARQQWREEILSTTASDFSEFAGILEKAKEHGLVAVMGSQAAIEAANAERPGWLQILKVL